MSVNIPTHFAQQFSSNVGLLLQQKGSKLRGAVSTGTHVGKQASPIDQIGAITAKTVTGRFNPKTRTDAQMDRRWVVPLDKEVNQLIDSYDKLRLLTDPSSKYVENAMFAIGRAMDEEIITRLHGTNLTGETGATSTTFPTANAVGVNQGAASATNLTFAKLREAKRLLMSFNNDVFSDQIFMAVNATCYDTLLSEIQITSRDFNPEPVLKDGKLTQVLGINIIHTELLVTGTDDQAGTSTSVPLWLKSGVHLGLWADIKTSISTRYDLESEPYQAMASATFGATRLEENKVIRIWAR